MHNKWLFSRVMKYVVITPLILVGMLYPWKGHAQDSPHEGESQNVALGLRLNLGAATYGGADADGEYGKSGYTVGYGVSAFGELPLAPWLSIQPEVAWNAKGASLDYTLGDPGSDRLSYLEIYLASWLTPFRFKVANPYLSLGPGVGFLLTCEAYDPLTGTDDCKDTRTALDVSIMMGLGTAVELSGPGRLFVEARYEIGMTSISDIEVELDVKNRALLFSIGYAHRLGGGDAR